jgi:hypothetical protein
MNKIFTLFALAAVLLISYPAFSQINEHFDNDSATLAADCWQFPAMKFTKSSGPSSGLIINNAGSIYSEPPVSGDSLRIMRTPLVAVGSSVDISFNYKLSNNLTGQATRTIQIDLTDLNGVVVQNLTTLTMSSSANNNTSPTLFSQTFPVTTPGTYRISITLSGSNGNGSVRLSLDDLSVNAPFVGCTYGFPLPVKLISFQGNLNSGKVNLQWTVAQNEINHRFEIERSNDGKSFTSKGAVAATTKQGTESYSFGDLVSAEKVYYRLKMFDKNLVVTYSKILAFQTKSLSGDNGIKILSNPATDKLTLSFASATSQSVQIKLYDLSGRVQMNQRITTYQGSNLVSLPISSAITTGMYVVELNSGSERQTAKFVKQ